MLFNSYNFLFIFLPITIALYGLAPASKKNHLLTIASFVFYGYWNSKLCALLFFSIAINFFLGQQIHRAVEQTRKKHYLIVALVVNLGLLGFFKYANFFLDSLQVMIPSIPLGTLSIVLPIGISFFTFQGISYSFDIYRKQSLPVRKFVDFACYISMFPQLIAGPIVRFNLVAEQLFNRQHSMELTAYGVRRFIVGLGKKVLLADTMAYIAQQHLSQGSPDGLNVWLGITAFSLQIYFDFAGYSDMAIGLGSIFGFRLPENFNHPYSAQGIFDFWRRWHMTLSGWLRDYLYIPLGGSRCRTGRWVVNIMVTFLLCGLWHGAAWTFVAWGGYYGILLIIERPFRKQIQDASKWVAIPLTNILVIIGWVFFKAETLDESILWLRAMFDFGGIGFTEIQPVGHVVVLTAFLVACWSGGFRVDRMFQGEPWCDTALVAVFLACFVSIMGVDVSPFLYYQF